MIKKIYSSLLLLPILFMSCSKEVKHVIYANEPTENNYYSVNQIIGKWYFDSVEIVDIKTSNAKATNYIKNDILETNKSKDILAKEFMKDGICIIYFPNEVKTSYTFEKNVLMINGKPNNFLYNIISIKDDVISYNLDLKEIYKLELTEQRPDLKDLVIENIIVKYSFIVE